MSGVWMFKDGVIRRQNPAASGVGAVPATEGRQGGGGINLARRKVLVHLPTGQVVSSYTLLEQILTDLGWERYYEGEPDLFQFHNHTSIDLISLPRDFSRFNSIHMYDLVIKNPSVFHVRDT